MNTKEQYARLLLLLSNDVIFSEKLAKDLVESDTHPSDFFEKHQGNYFHSRGIIKAGNKEQTLCYMLDVLGENDYAYELDWKADSEELNYALQQISRGKVTEDLVSEEEEEDVEGMFELIEIAEDLLEEYDLAIVQFPLDSDSHPIALVSMDQQDEIQELIDDLF